MEVATRGGGGRVRPGTAGRLRAHLERLYPPPLHPPEQVDEVHDRLCALLAEHAAAHPPGRAPAVPFDETDVVLITYADQVREPARQPLATLAEVLGERVAGPVTGVHVLPFYPWTSDDGFSVVDYDAVDPELGDWDDIARLARQFRLMVDAVFNHVSSRGPWFEGWRQGDPRFQGFFVEADPSADLSAVVRPRSSPLLTPVGTTRGVRHVWTTFSADQVDLDYSNPEVLLAVTRSLLGYLAHRAGIVRLDAVAFLWKQPGTSCVHLPQTHELVRLWRTVVDAVAPGTLLVTETNVPHAENVSYFGDGDDEAHLVYQFPLAPLVLSTFHLADASVLCEWAAGLTTPSPQTTFLNFLSSHDGIGVRPAEGLLTPAEIGQLCDLSRAHGGGVSLRAEPDGHLTPYELNTSLFTALNPVDTTEPLTTQVDRFLSAQSILLALAGVPAVYVHSLFGSTNWLEGVEATGRLRTINREKFDRRTLERALGALGSRRQQVFTRLLERIRVRVGEPAFHPNAAQRMLDAPPALFALQRTTVDGRHVVVCLHNVSGREQVFAGAGLPVRGDVVDLLSGHRTQVTADGLLRVRLAPYGVAWLRGSSP